MSIWKPLELNRSSDHRELKENRGDWDDRWYGRDFAGIGLTLVRLPRPVYHHDGCCRHQGMELISRPSTRGGNDHPCLGGAA